MLKSLDKIHLPTIGKIVARHSVAEWIEHYKACRAGSKAKQTLFEVDDLLNVYFIIDIMKASILDLRYKTKEVLEALDRNEEVTILYRGKLKGRIFPVRAKSPNARRRANEHPYFGSMDDSQPVDDTMNQLRGDRY